MDWDCVYTTVPPDIIEKKIAIAKASQKLSFWRSAPLTFFIRTLFQITIIRRVYIATIERRITSAIRREVPDVGIYYIGR